MTTPYTRRLFAHGGATTGSERVYVVPDGVVAIVRDLVAYTPSSTAVTINLYVVSPGISYQIWAVTLDSSNYYAHLEMRQALEPGWEIWVITSGDLNLAATGYLLQLPAIATAAPGDLP